MPPIEASFLEHERCACRERSASVISMVDEGSDPTNSESSRDGRVSEPGVSTSPGIV